MVNDHVTVMKLHELQTVGRRNEVRENKKYRRDIVQSNKVSDHRLTPDEDRDF